MSNVCHGDGDLLTVFLQTVFLSLNSCLVEYRHEIMGTQCIIIQSTTTLAVFPPNSITVFFLKKKDKYTYRKQSDLSCQSFWAEVMSAGKIFPPNG